MKVIVIYYDGFENKAKMCETEYPDSSQPDMFGLGADEEVVAVIGLTGDKEEPVEVYIDELKVEISE